MVRYLTGLSPLTNAVFGPVYGWAVLILLAIAVAQQLTQARRTSRAQTGVASRKSALPPLRVIEPAASVSHVSVLPIS
jgi:hypothetical protein